MGRWWLLALAGLLGGVAVLLLSPASIPTPDGDATWISALRPWGHVVGRVLDGDGQPVAGATVLAQDLRGFGGRAITDPAGGYHLRLARLASLDPPWPGKSWKNAVAPSEDTPLILGAIADGFCGSTHAKVRALIGQAVEAPPIRVWRGGWIRGRTFDAEGRAVGALVRVVAVRGAVPRPAGLEALPDEARRNSVDSMPDEGFRFGPIPPGEVELWAVAVGRGGASQIVNVEEAATTDVQLVLDLRVSIAGRVIDGDDAGVAKIRVYCMKEPVRDTAALPRGSPEADAPMRETAESPLFTRPWRRRSRGHDTPMREPSRFELSLQRGTLATATDENGRFYFYAVQPGASYSVGIVDAGATPGTRTRGVEVGRRDLVLEMPPTSDVEAFIVDSSTNEPVAGCVVQSLSEKAATYLVRELPLGLVLRGEGAVRTDAAGRFRLTDTFEGTYRLNFLAPGYEIESRTVTVSPDGPVRGLEDRVPLHPTPDVVGTVLSADSAPARGVRVWATVVSKKDHWPEPGSVRWIGSVSTDTDVDGRFALTGLPSELRLRIRAKDDDGLVAQATVIPSEAKNANVELRLAKPARIRVAVRPKSEGTLLGHPIRVIGIDDPDVDIRTTSDRAGLARIRDLPPGRYRVTAVDAREDMTRPEVQARVREIEVGPGLDTSVVIPVADVTVVIGTVHVGEKRPNVAKVGFGPIDGTQDHYEALLFDVHHGRFECRIPPGTYHVHLSIPGKRFELAEPFVIPTAATHEVELRVDPH